MTIHLDTNILPQRGSLRNGSITAVLRIARARGLDVIISEIVLHESVHQRLEKVGEEVGKVRRAIAEASAYIPVEPVYLPDPLDLAQQWEDDLRAVFTVLPASEGDAAEALRREARRIRPARAGRGSRDSLIWLTTLRESKRSTGPTYLVTNNTNDFAEDKSSKVLHAELQREADQADSEIILCTSIESLLSHISEKISFAVDVADIRSRINGYDVVSELLLGPWSDQLEEEAERPWTADTSLILQVVEVKTHRAHQVDKVLLAWTTSTCTLHFHYPDGEDSQTIRVLIDAWVLYEDGSLTDIEVLNSSRTSLETGT